MKRVLAVGGSGGVGTLIFPYLREKYAIRVFDLKPPRASDVEFSEGDATDLEALRQAMAGCDLLLYMPLFNQEVNHWNHLSTAKGHFDVNVTGLYLALGAAHEAGVAHAVYASSMSVYDPLWGRYFPHEFLAPDSTQLYGMTKRLGEEVCKTAVAEWEMTVTALRLCKPVSSADWQARVAQEGDAPFLWTREDDVARAFDLALAKPLGGFDAFTICGDWREKAMRLGRARTILGWEPLARPETQVGDRVIG